MSRILINESNLNDALAIFKKALRREGEISLTNLKDSQYFREQEGYKDSIYAAAKLKLDEGTWEKRTIGQGKLIDTVISAVEVLKNNLITSFHGGGKNGLGHRLLYDLREGDFSRRRDYEIWLYRLYKDTEGFSYEDIFAGFLRFPCRYSLLAYLFFIKDCTQYLPISPDNFDFVFNKLGVNFKASHKCSWSNYRDFIDLVQQVQKFLCDNVNANTSLLDAHSFLWILKQEYEAPVAIDPDRERIIKAIKAYKETGKDFLSVDDLNSDTLGKYAFSWQGSFYPAEEIYKAITGRMVQDSATIQEIRDFFKKHKLKIKTVKAASEEQDKWDKEEAKRLEKLGPDKTAEAIVRREQKMLRKKLLRKRTKAPCGLCGEVMPEELLIAAHIKRRSECTTEEQNDIQHVAMLACIMGCDALFEKGYIGVREGKNCVSSSSNLPEKVRVYLNVLNGKDCTAWKERSKKYFDWHNSRSKDL